tara:strand:- start:91 stop:813 length:723 start_codon:yes stop_codon:yes gene_type:complete
MEADDTLNERVGDELGAAMSELDNVDESNPEASAEFEAQFEAQFGALLGALLGDPTMWDSPGDDLSDRVVSAISSESVHAPATYAAPSGSQGRRSWVRPALLGAAAAIAFLFGGLVLLSGLSGVEDVDSFSAELVPTGLTDDQSGAITVTSFDSGLRIELDAASLPRRDNGSFYAGWLTTLDGDLFPVGTFHDGVEVTLWAGVELERVEMFTITLETAAGPGNAGQESSGDVVLRTEINP